MLARGDARVGRHSVSHRFALVIAIRPARSTMLLIAVCCVHSDMPILLKRPIFWIKVIFPLSVVSRRCCTRCDCRVLALTRKCMGSSYFFHCAGLANRHIHYKSRRR
ncbi:NrsF family protein [Burkholderia sp. PAMC 28687]|uniref:NrsF family protein n=1 Tax=Burkholderia sp. PAMC 28687 TaxID=1795874 RepID=UPI003FA4B0B3